MTRTTNNETNEKFKLGTNTIVGKIMRSCLVHKTTTLGINSARKL